MSPEIGLECFGSLQRPSPCQLPPGVSNVDPDGDRIESQDPGDDEPMATGAKEDLAVPTNGYVDLVAFGGVVVGSLCSEAIVGGSEFSLRSISLGTDRVVQAIDRGQLARQIRPRWVPFRKCAPRKDPV